jgi:hypothetical protein
MRRLRQITAPWLTSLAALADAWWDAGNTQIAYTACKET